MSIRKNKVFTKVISLCVAVCFVSSMFLPTYVQAQELVLPAPNQFVGLSEVYSFPVLKGMKFNPTEPLRIEFIIDTANEKSVTEQEASRLIRYFLAGLTLPEEELWVNMSPYEKERMITENLAQTDLGKDLLGQDYILKQLSASLVYPENETGRGFWQKVYQEVLKVAKTTKVPVNTFNKIWIVPDKAVVYENKYMGLITEATLKAMLEEDYLALQNNIIAIQKEKKNLKEDTIEKINKTASEVMRSTILPKINQEVNSGKNFATLRQIYHSVILAIWFKEKFKDSVYQHYINKGKVKGIDLADKDAKDKIFALYAEAFKKGLYDYIKTEPEPRSHRQIKRRYFSGGLKFYFKGLRNKVETVTSAKSPLGVSDVMGTFGAPQPTLVPIEMNPETGKPVVASPLSREELETSMANMLGNIIHIAESEDNGLLLTNFFHFKWEQGENPEFDKLVSNFKKIWADSLKTTGLSDQDIKSTYPLILKFLDSYIFRDEVGRKAKGESPDSIIKRYAQELTNRAIKAAPKQSGSPIVWTELSDKEIPQSFAGVLEDFGLSKPKVLITRLQGDLPPEEALNDIKTRAVIKTSIGQALGSILFAGAGKDGKKVADATAVEFSRRNIVSFVQTNPKETVVIMADEGERDEAVSLKRGRIYWSGYEKGYWDPDPQNFLDSLENEIKRLRQDGININYFAGDALEHTNGLIIHQAVNHPTNSWSLAALFDDTSDEIRKTVWDKFRIAGTSFNAPTDAGVQPLDLPSVATRKVAIALAKEKGIEENSDEFKAFYADYMNHLETLTLGARDKDLAKQPTQSGDSRHLAIIEDAKELQKQYPGLKLLTPGDGDAAPSVVSVLGLDLDGYTIMKFGRSGATEATMVKLVAKLVRNGQFSNRFLSETETAKEVSPRTAENYTNKDIEKFVELGYFHDDSSAHTRTYQAKDLKGGGVFAMTAVTGASEEFFGKTFSELMQQVTFQQASEYTKKGAVTVNTLAVTPDGSVFVVRSTFQAKNLDATKNNIQKASPEAKEYLKTYPNALNAPALVNNIKGVITLTEDGVTINDVKKLKEETVYYLVDEARFGANDDVKLAAARILREVGIALGGIKEASIHDFYMARQEGKWEDMTVPAYNFRTGPTFDAMVEFFKAAIDQKVGLVDLELAASEMRYTGQSADEYVAMMYAAAIVTGYKGLIFAQADHYQVKEYTAKEMEAAKKRIRKAVLAGKKNIDIDPSTLVQEKVLDNVLWFERMFTTRYIKNRAAVDPEFAKMIADLGGLKENPANELEGIWSLRRKLVDDLEVGLKVKKYSQSLSEQEKEYIQGFGLSEHEHGYIRSLYTQMHEITIKATKELVQYIRDLEKELGLKTPVSIGVEERHIDNPKHAKYPSTVLGSITVMSDIIVWCKEKGFAQPSKLALQTGAMHGLGGVVDWGIFERHQLAADEIGVAVFVQHGTSTLPDAEFVNMPRVGTGEAHLATEYQKITYDEIGKGAPTLREKMVRFMEALMSPDLTEDQIDPDIVAKLKSSDLWKKRGDYNKKFAKRWKEVIFGMAGVLHVDIPINNEEELEIWMGRKVLTQEEIDNIFIGILGDTLPKPYKGKLKDLAKELSAPFKKEIDELPKEVKDKIRQRLSKEFRRINVDLNVVNTLDLVEEIMPFDQVEVSLPERPAALKDAVASSPFTQEASSAIDMQQARQELGEAQKKIGELAEKLKTLLDEAKTIKGNEQKLIIRKQEALSLLEGGNTNVVLEESEESLPGIVETLNSEEISFNKKIEEIKSTEIAIDEIQDKANQVIGVIVAYYQGIKSQGKINLDKIEEGFQKEIERIGEEIRRGLSFESDVVVKSLLEDLKKRISEPYLEHNRVKTLADFYQLIRNDVTLTRVSMKERFLVLESLQRAVSKVSSPLGAVVTPAGLRELIERALADSDWAGGRARPNTSPGGIDLGKVKGKIGATPSSIPVNMPAIDFDLQNFQGFTFRILGIKPMPGFSSVLDMFRKAEAPSNPEFAYLGR